MVAALIVGLLLSTAGTGFAQPPPPCINYVHTEEAGRVEVDLRQSKDGTWSSLAVFWFINDAGSAPGFYNWPHIVNGRSLTPQLIYKDDNFHTTFHTRDGWYFGDTYKLQATHYSPATKTTYIAAVNECLITPR